MDVKTFGDPVDLGNGWLALLVFHFRDVGSWDTESDSPATLCESSFLAETYNPFADQLRDRGVEFEKPAAGFFSSRSDAVANPLRLHYSHRKDLRLGFRLNEQPFAFPALLGSVLIQLADGTANSLH